MITYSVNFSVWISNVVLIDKTHITKSSLSSTVMISVRWFWDPEIWEQLNEPQGRVPRSLSLFSAPFLLLGPPVPQPRGALGLGSGGVPPCRLWAGLFRERRKSQNPRAPQLLGAFLGKLCLGHKGTLGIKRVCFAFSLSGRPQMEVENPLPGHKDLNVPCGNILFWMRLPWYELTKEFRASLQNSQSVPFEGKNSW